VIEERVPVDRLRDGCFEWLTAHFSGFRWFDADAASRGPRLKAFGELLSILTACRRRAPLSHPAAQLAELALGTVEELDWESQLIRDPAFIVAVLTVAEFLDRAGADASGPRAVVERALATGVVAALDLVPYRKMEIEHLLVRAGFRPLRAPAFARTFRESLARLEKPLPLFTVQDAYALTHIVFFLCDDGTRDAAVLASPDEVARLRWLTETSARIALIDHDVDLTAELIVADAFLGRPDPWLVAEGVARALARRNAGGGVPGGRGDAFLDVYHSTLMWAYACTVLATAGDV
jgi:Domain of unknown function (DUF6895)